MDLRHYFQKIREIEAALPETDVLVVSLGTSDGGKAGTMTEVPKKVAAKMIAESRATLATVEHEVAFRAEQELGKMAFEKAEMAKRVQVAIVSDRDFQSSSASRLISGTSPRK